MSFCSVLAAGRARTLQHTPPPADFPAIAVPECSSPGEVLPPVGALASHDCAQEVCFSHRQLVASVAVRSPTARPRPPTSSLVRFGPGVRCDGIHSAHQRHMPSHRQPSSSHPAGRVCHNAAGRWSCGSWSMRGAKPALGETDRAGRVHAAARTPTKGGAAPWLAWGARVLVRAHPAAYRMEGGGRWPLRCMRAPATTTAGPAPAASRDGLVRCKPDTRGTGATERGRGVCRTCNASERML